MACDLKPACAFFFGYLRCSIPVDTIDVELTVRTVKGIHTFRKDHTSEQATCRPLSRQMTPLLSLRKKIEEFEEEKNDENSPFHPNPITFTKKEAPTRRSRERSHKRSQHRRLDMSHFIPPKAKRVAYLWVLLPATNTAATTTMATNTRIAITNPTMAISCKVCKRWGALCSFCAPSAPLPSSQESDWSNEDWNSN